jgi:CxxC-x17-CxxC domain-containing protein
MKGAAPAQSGSPIRLRRGSAPHFRESGPRKAGKFWVRVSASCPQGQGIRARRPRIQVSSSISALRYKVRPLPRPPRDQGERLMEYHDRVLKCSECSAEFVFTAGEQMFFADKGFKNEPKRCKACKAKRAEGGGGGGHASPMRSETKTNCSQCGKETTVPFRPTQGRPVFCRECFQQRRAMGAA